MEDVASIHNLLSRTDMEISSPMVLALTISFVYNTFLCTFCSPMALFLILMKEIFLEKKKKILADMTRNFEDYMLKSTCHTCLEIEISKLYINKL